MRLGGVLKAALLVAMAGAVSTAEARAADMPLYDTPGVAYPEAEQPLQFGTGWYLRGDGAYAEGDRPAFRAATTSFDRNATASGYAFGLGAGYKFNSFMRVDMTSDYLDPFDYAGQVGCGTGCTVTAKDHVWRWDSLVNGYIDLGTWYGVTPYIGAGAGVGATRRDTEQSTSSTGVADVRTRASRNGYEFAWAAMAGFSYAFTQNAMVDIGYRYLDLGRTSIQLNPVAATQKDITEHQVRVGLRYMVD